MSAVQSVPTQRPWWREPYVWLVISGPLVVVVAGIVTVVIAVKNPDPVLQARPASSSTVPAQKGRNHAASPDVSVGN